MADVTRDVEADPPETTPAAVIEGVVAGPVRSSRLPRFLSEPMWVLGLVLLVDEIETLCRQGRNEPLSEPAAPAQPGAAGLDQLLPARVSKATFGYLRAYTWARVVGWLRRKHPHANWKRLRRRYLPWWWPTEGDTTLFDPNAVAINYARYRGQISDATPWARIIAVSPA